MISLYPKGLFFPDYLLCIIKLTCPLVEQGKEGAAVIASPLCVIKLLIPVSAANPLLIQKLNQSFMTLTRLNDFSNS